MKKKQLGIVDSSSPDMIGIEGRLINRKAIGPKALKEIDKNCAKMQKHEKRCLKAATKVLRPPSKIKTWARRLALGVLLMPVAPVVATIGSCIPQQKPAVAVCEPTLDRSWLDHPEDAEALKKELFSYFLKHIDEHVPSNITPIDRGGKLLTSSFTYRGVEFIAVFYYLYEDTKDGFSGSSLNIQISEGGFEEQLKIFAKDKGIKL